MTRVSLGLAALATAGLLAACGPAEGPDTAEVRPVRVTTIGALAGANTVSLTGAVQAETEINKSFRIDGRMVERNVGIGDAVRPGQVIARLDPQNEQAGVDTARAQLAAAQAQQVEAQNNFARMRDLVAENAVSRAAFDQAQALLKTANSQVQAVQAQVALAGNRLSYTNLVSDVAGVVTAQGAEPGEVVGAGRMIVQIARDGGRDAVFDIPAQIKDRAPANRDVTVSLTLDPSVTAIARVREVSPRADPVTGTFRVRLRLINPPPAMRLGSTVTGRMQLGTISGFLIPAAAAIRANGSPAVWVVDPTTHTVKARAVSITDFDPGRVVVGSGLAPGDMVVTAGAQALRGGQKVRPLETTL